ncbi:MAG TPA: PAS domain S-box protein, partial [Nitrospiria bacterium]|nr:PAS domain S-box protein [Nitrospiria bacterium]
MKEGERFRRAFEDAAIGIALLAVEPLGKYLEVNPTFCRMTGYSRKELLTRNFQSITASQDVGSNIEQLQVLLQGSILFIKLEKRYLRKDGSAFWARLNVSLVRDERNHPLYFIVQIEDIDERKRTEEQLRRSKALLTEAQQVGRIGNWNWDIPTNVITWSDQMYRIFGIAPQEGPMPYETFLNYVHPEDREDVKRITQKALQDHQPFDHDRRIVWPDGTIHVYHSRGVVELDAAGKPIRLYGTAQDITERKRMEEALFEN